MQRHPGIPRVHTDLFRPDSPGSHPSSIGSFHSTPTPKRRVQRSATNPHFSTELLQDVLQQERTKRLHRGRPSSLQPSRRPDRSIDDFHLTRTPFHPAKFSRFDGRDVQLRRHYSLDSLLTPPREKNRAATKRGNIHAMDLAAQRKKKRENLYEVIPADAVSDEPPRKGSVISKGLCRLKSSFKSLIHSSGNSSAASSNEQIHIPEFSTLSGNNCAENMDAVSIEVIQNQSNANRLKQESMNSLEKPGIRIPQNNHSKTTNSHETDQANNVESRHLESRRNTSVHSLNIDSNRRLSSSMGTEHIGQSDTQSVAVSIDSKSSRNSKSSNPAESQTHIESSRRLSRTPFDLNSERTTNSLNQDRKSSLADILNLDSSIPMSDISSRGVNSKVIHGARRSDSSHRLNRKLSKSFTTHPTLQEEPLEEMGSESTSGDSGLCFTVHETPERKIQASKSTGKDNHFLNAKLKQEKSKKKTTKQKPDEDEGGIYKFDVAKIIPKDRVSSSETFENFLKFLRVLIYVLIFITLLASLTSSMGAFLLLEAVVLKDQDHRWNAQHQLLWIICVPSVLVLITSFFKCLFGTFEWPTRKVFCVIMITELVHCFGVALLVFRVLPHFGSFFAVGIINSIAVIPVILKISFTRLDLTRFWFCSFENIIFRATDMIALCVQVGVFVIPVWLDDNIDKLWKDEKYVLKWQLPLAVVCVSIKWWENFVSKNRWFCQLKELKKRFHSTRYISNIATSTLNIVMSVSFMYLFEYIYSDRRNFSNYLNPPLPQDNDDYGQSGTFYNESMGDNVQNNETYTGSSGKSTECEGINCADDYLATYTPCIVVIFGSLLAYYLAGLACKLLMQVVSFTLPTVLSTPLVLAWMMMQCQNSVNDVSTDGLNLEFMCNQSNYRIIILAFLWWFSLVWITRHIWNPDIDRLALNERSFLNTLYCGPLVTQSLMLNRRNDQQDKLIELHFSNEKDIELAYNKTQYTDDKAFSWDAKKNKRIVPKIYACGTMWHETRNEMVQLLKSVMRMDIDQNCRMIAEDFFRIIDPDFYEFETHIFFDDCMDIDEDDKWIPNQFVIQFINCLDEAASSVHKEARELEPPIRIPTPYGGQLVWTLPCGNHLTVHLKDKNKIRHRKRWSQVMYMYYLLGYRLFEEPEDEIEELFKEKLKRKDTAATPQPEGGEPDQENNNPHAHRLLPGFGRSDIFQDMSYKKLQEAENTFILALDGDVDFKPEAVKLLVDRMKVNPKVGAACGRIHPIGSGPLVWYQQFEYAIGHWFQKATEHVLGCVLCSPGCFSLFRGSALLDDNVMRRYATEPTEAAHYIQYDQGEDRWLCTLLLQQGYRIDYSAASDALTYAPESFDEFFNQRRRWTPSTIANNMDLIGDSKNTILINSNMSYLYMAYQFVLMVAMVLGPSTITLAISTAFLSVLEITLWQAYALSLGPCVFYIAVCFKCKINTQLAVAAVLSAFYACIMTVVLVGIIQTIVSQSFLNPSLLFLGAVSSSFVFSAMIHPYEFECLLYGFLYYLCIPAGYLILMIYSITNLHVVSWGTREVKKRKTKAQMIRDQALEEKRQAEKAKKKGNILKYLHLDVFLKELKETVTQAFSRSKELSKQDKTEKYMRKMLKEMRKMRLGVQYVDSSDSEDERKSKKAEETKEPETQQPPQPPPEDEEEIEIAPDDLEDPNFIKDSRLGGGPLMPLNHKEELFFKRLIKKYLHPIKKDAKKEKAMSEELLALRTNASFGFWFVNLLWVLFNYMINRDAELNVIFVYGYETQPLGFVFILFFMIVLMLQVVGMIIHRWDTFLQLISIVELKSPIRHKQLEDSGAITPTEALKIVAEVQKSKPIFGDVGLQDSDEETYHAMNPELRTRKVIANTRKLVDRNRDLERNRRRRRQHRNKDHVVEVDPSERPEGSRHHREERLDRQIDRYNRDRMRHRRESINYRSTVQRHFSEQYGYLGNVRRRSNAPRRVSSDMRLSERTTTIPRPTRRDHEERQRPMYHLRHDDVNLRARRRLNGLARDR